MEDCWVSTKMKKIEIMIRIKNKSQLTPEHSPHVECAWAEMLKPLAKSDGQMIKLDSFKLKMVKIAWNSSK